MTSSRAQARKPVARKPAPRPAAQPQRAPAPQAQAPSNGAGTQVAERPGTAVAKVDFKDVGPNAGMEGADRDSFAIPFLLVLQKMSPQLDRNAAEYLEGAKEGDFLNTATQETYDGQEGVLVMPTSFKRSFVAWVIREKGGGFKGEYSPTDPIIITTKQDEKGRNMLPDGHTQLVDTRLHAVILLNGDRPEPALLTLTSTQIKKSKRWMTQMQEMQRGDSFPTFAHAYKLSTVPESNDKGSWMGLQVDYESPVTEQEHIDAAVSFYHALQSGQARMKADTTAAGVAAAE